MERDLQDTTMSPEVLAKYEITNNSFILTGDNPKDLIVAEVGDIQQSDLFYPQIKIKRWDNEINMSIRHIDDDVDIPVITTDQDKVGYDKEKRSISFYNLAPQPGLEEGGYELELTLKEKPASNVINFSIKTKGLNFYYQPELTAEEIIRGFTRPDNVVGSYVIYYDNCPLNVEGGKEYKCGKMGYIPRPKITDSLGASVWGELDIDPVAETLTVTIPQDFLDSATYPINHAAGLTFGYTSIGASTGGSAFNYIFAHQLATPAFTGVAESISVYFSAAGVGAKSTAGFYLAPADYPTDLVAGSAEISSVGSSWNVFNLSGEAVSAGVQYRISMQLGIAATSMRYDAAGGNKDYFLSRAYTAGAMPDPFPVGATGAFNSMWSSFVTYVLPSTAPQDIMFWN